MSFRLSSNLVGVCSIVALMSLGCFGGEPSPPITSPSGEYVAFGAPSGPEAGDDQFCVVLHVTDRAGHEFTFQSHASDNMKWALAWADENTLVLYSSDMGTTAYDVAGGSISVRDDPTPDEQQAANAAYLRTYGQPPHSGFPPAAAGK